MPKKAKKQVKKVSNTQVTLGQLRILFYFFFLTALFLFYPGKSYYAEVFSYHRELFSDSTKLDESFAPKRVPYVSNRLVQPELTAQGVYIIDLETATPLYERNKDGKFFPASTTKVLSALAARDVYKLDDILEVKSSITEGQVADLIVGEKLTFENVLYATLIHSGNDAAYVLADNYPGGYDAFIRKMNAKAAELGMKNSHFTNPAGLDESDQYSSPFDLALAGRKLLQDKELSKIVSTKSITISDVDFTHFHALFNVNKLLGEIPGVGGLKTGKTELAGENLITLYKYNDNEFLIILMKSEDRFKDTEHIVEWIKSNIVFSHLL